jgi:hypothetical protein
MQWCTCGGTYANTHAHNNTPSRTHGPALRMRCRMRPTSELATARELRECDEVWSDLCAACI